MKKLSEVKLQWIHKALLLVFADVLIILSSYLLALLLRFDFRFTSIPRAYIDGYLWSMPFWVISTIVVFYICRLYHSIWRLASIAELQMLLSAYAVLAPIYFVGAWFMHLHMPLSYYFIGYMVCFCLTTGIRFSYRLLRSYVSHHDGQEAEKDRIMIIGGGDAGQTLIRELVNSDKIHTRVCCVIDDNPNKRGRILGGGSPLWETVTISRRR